MKNEWVHENAGTRAHNGIDRETVTVGFFYYFFYTSLNSQLVKLGNTSPIKHGLSYGFVNL